VWLPKKSIHLHFKLFISGRTKRAAFGRFRGDSKRSEYLSKAFDDDVSVFASDATRIGEVMALMHCMQPKTHECYKCTGRRDDTWPNLEA